MSDDFEDFNDGFDDFDFDFDDNGKNRKPIDRIKSGFRQGVQSKMADRDFQKRFLKGVLPKEYSKGIEGASAMARELDELYNTSSSEVRKTARSARSFLRNTAPNAMNFMPESMVKKFNEWIDEGETGFGDGYGQQNVEEASIQSMLGEIFKAQAEQDIAQETESAKKEIVEKRKFASQQKLFDRIRVANERMVAYQDNVTAAYQKKNLELQMRQYLTLRSIDRTLIDFSKTSLKLQQATMKNTALPDFAKLSLATSARKSFREQLFGKLTGGPLSTITELLRGTGANMMKGAREGITDFMETFRDALDSAEDFSDFDKVEMGGSLLGGMTTERAARILGKKLRGGILKSRHGAKVLDKGHQFSRLFGDPERALAAWLQRSSAPDMEDDFPKYDAQGNEIKRSKWERIKRAAKQGQQWAVRYIRENAPNLDPDQVIVKGNSASLYEPTAMTGKFTRTVEEVIPKLLTMMYGELYSLRTGKPADSLVYNFKEGKFVSAKGQAQQLFGRIFSEDRRKHAKESIDETYQQVVGTRRVSAKARNAIKQRLIEDANKGVGFDYAGYQDPRSWENVDEKTRNELVKIFSSRFSGVGKEGLASKVDEALKNASLSVPSVGNDLIYYLMGGGDRDVLRSLGITKSTSAGEVLDKEKVRQFLYQGGTPELGDIGDIGGHGTLDFSALGGMRPSAGGRPRRNITFRSRMDTKGISSALGRMQDTLGAGFMEQSDYLKRITDATEMSALWLEEIAVKGVQSAAGYGEGGDGRSMGSINVDLGKFGEREYWKKLRDKFGIYGKVKRGIGRVRDFLGRHVPPILSGARAGITAGIEVGKKGAQAAGNYIVDVYVVGRATAALRAELVKDGRYIDVNTGKVIEKIKDITGAVYDSVTQREVISQEEFDNGLLDGTGHRIWGALNKAGDMGNKVFFDVLPRMLRSVPGLMNELGQQARSLIDGPQDVYVKGKKGGPVLLARGMREGEYFSVDTQKRIRRPSDIDGAVVDQDGEVVLSQKDFEKGLVDKDGKPFESLRTRFGNTLGRIGDDLSDGLLTGKRLLQHAGGMALNAIGNVVDRLGDFSFPGLFIGNQRGTISAINRIYNLLAPQFGADLIDENTGVSGAGAGGGNAGGLLKKFGKWLNEKGDDAQAKARRTKALQRLRRMKRKDRGKGLLDGIGWDNVPFFGGFADRFRSDFGEGEDDDGADGNARSFVDRILGRRRRKMSASERSNRAIREDARRSGSWSKKMGLGRGIRGALGGLGRAGAAIGKWTLGGLWDVVSGLGKVIRPIMGLLTRVLLNPYVLGGLGIAGAGYGISALLFGKDKTNAAIGNFLGDSWTMAKTGWSTLTGTLGNIAGGFKNIFGPSHDPATLRKKKQEEAEKAKEEEEERKEKAAEAKKSKASKDSIAEEHAKAVAAAKERAKGKYSLADKIRGVDYLDKKGITNPVVRTLLTATPLVVGMQGWRVLEAGSEVFKSITDTMYLTKLRCVQYGFSKIEDAHLRKVQNLEYYLLNNTTVDAKGENIQINISARATDIFGLFGIKSNEKERQDAFMSWFTHRFTPVYKAHVRAFRLVTAEYGMNNQVTDLLKIDDTMDYWKLREEFIEYLDVDRFKIDKASPFAYLASPFDAEVPLTEDEDAVESFVKWTLRYIKAEAAIEWAKGDSPKKGDGKTTADWTKTARQNAAEAKAKQAQAAKAALAKAANDKSTLNNPITAGALGDAAVIARVKGMDNSGLKLLNRSAVGLGPDVSGAPSDWVWPTDGTVVSSPWGGRIDPVTGKPEGHQGIDIAVPMKSPVYAVADGYVYRCYLSKSYGNVIYIRHGGGLCSRYAHLYEFAPGIKAGVKVAKGELIAYSGGEPGLPQSGKSTGPHLHFEIRKNDDQWAPTLDPLEVLKGDRTEKAKRQLHKEVQSEADDGKGDKTPPPSGATATPMPKGNLVMKGAAAEASKAQAAQQTSEAAKVANIMASVTAPMGPVDVNANNKAAILRQYREQTQAKARAEREHDVALATQHAQTSIGLAKIGQQQLDVQMQILTVLTEMASKSNTPPVAQAPAGRNNVEYKPAAAPVIPMR